VVGFSVVAVDSLVLVLLLVKVEEMNKDFWCGSDSSSDLLQMSIGTRFYLDICTYRCICAWLSLLARTI